MHGSFFVTLPQVFKIILKYSVNSNKYNFWKYLYVFQVHFSHYAVQALNNARIGKHKLSDI